MKRQTKTKRTRARRAKPVATKRAGAKKCGHKRYLIVDRTRSAVLCANDYVSTQCTHCKAIGVRSLGPSDDTTPRVAIEIRAGEILHRIMASGIWRATMTAQKTLSDNEYRGWIDHMYGDTAGMAGTEHATAEELAGWLARYIGDPYQQHQTHEIETTRAEDAAAIARERLKLADEAHAVIPGEVDEKFTDKADLDVPVDTSQKMDEVMRREGRLVLNVQLPVRSAVAESAADNELRNILPDEDAR